MGYDPRLFAGSPSAVGRGLVAALALGAVLVAAHASAQNIGKFTAGKSGYQTNSFWIEGSDGLVLIDTQFLLSDAVKFVETAERATGKKAVAAIVLHPNPDKFNGVATLQARGIRVITSRQVRDQIAPIHKIRLGWYYDKLKPDYPHAAPEPEVFGDRTTTLRLAGVELTLHVLTGTGCSAAHVVVQQGDRVFVGDLIAAKGHAWMELGENEAWAHTLDALEPMQPRSIYPGRGPIGGPELIPAQREYLRFVDQLVAAEKPTGELGFFKRASLRGSITQRYPDYIYPEFVWEGLPAVWRKHAQGAR
jgi:glyoxylase-like metal-dependent hydrolase (beta-lactamase superfamily II)